MAARVIHSDVKLPPHRSIHGVKLPLVVFVIVLSRVFAFTQTDADKCLRRV